VYWSVGTESFRGGTDAEITAVSFCTRSAQLGLTPLTILDGKLDVPGVTKRWADQVDPFRRGILERAVDTVSERRRRRDASIIVGDVPGTDGFQYCRGLTPGEIAVAVEEGQWEGRPPRTAAAFGPGARQRPVRSLTAARARLDVEHSERGRGFTLAEISQEAPRVDAEVCRAAAATLATARSHVATERAHNRNNRSRSVR
jgi:hypothetical protein